MTTQQTAWLTANPTYSPVGSQLHPGTKYTSVGVLNPDGTFELIVRGTKNTAQPGWIGVGVAGT